MSLGCMVLTRPSSISGKPVTSSTSVTGMPESLSNFAVPPVEMSCTPRSVSPLANDSTPLLLNTEMRARWTFTGTLLLTDDPWGVPRQRRAPCGNPTRKPTSGEERRERTAPPAPRHPAAPRRRAYAKRAAAAACSASTCAAHAAAGDVIVDDAGRLHQRVGRRGPDEAEAAPLELHGKRGRLGAGGGDGGARPRRRVRLRAEAPEEPGQPALGAGQLRRRAGVGDRRLDLEPVADDAGVAEQAFDVGGAEGGHGRDAEPGEGRPEALALAQDRQPRQAALERLEGEPLEQAVVVRDRAGPTPRRGRRDNRARRRRPRSIWAGRRGRHGERQRRRRLPWVEVTASGRRSRRHGGDEDAMGVARPRVTLPPAGAGGAVAGAVRAACR